MSKAPEGHARLSPSKFESLMLCPGKLAMEETCPPDKGSAYAQEGTDAHEYAAFLLAGEPGEMFVSKEMDEFVTTYVETVRRMAPNEYFTRLIEQRLDVSEVVGVPNQFGTADVVAIGGRELQIHDLKYGMGVAVVAEWNIQLMVYALAALREFSTVFGEVDNVLLVIHMPRLDYVSEWRISVADLEAWAEKAAKAGRDAIRIADAGMPARQLSEYLTPGEKQCRFCKAKGKCPAYTAFVSDAIGADFQDLTKVKPKTGDPTAEDLEQLGKDMEKIDMIEQWCKAKRALTEAWTFSGFKVPGWKLVEGKRGSRKWSDEEEVEKLMKAAKLKSDEMYDKSLISAPAAEKLLKKDKPKLWEKLAAKITQAEGKPSVAPENDPRPAIALTPAEDDFQNLATGEDLT